MLLMFGAILAFIAKVASYSLNSLTARPALRMTLVRYLFAVVVSIFYAVFYTIESSR